MPARFDKSIPPEARDVAWLFALGLAFRAALIAWFPVAYGEDAIGRVYFQDRLLLAHWLPLTQALVFVTGKLGGGLLAVRLVFAAVGALAAGGFYLFLRRLTERRWAFVGGVLFSFNALFVTLSLLPYQDVLFLGLFFAGLAFLFQEPLLRSRVGAAFYGLACLTRYEAWFVWPVLVGWKARREPGGTGWVARVKALGRAALWFGWAPALWLLLSELHFQEWSGFLFQTADRTFFGWQPHFDLAWMAGYAGRMLFWVVRFGSPVVVLALPGLLWLWRRRGRWPAALRMFAVFTAAVLVYFFVLIGKEQESVNRYAAVPLSAVLVLTALGCEVVWRWVRERGGWLAWPGWPAAGAGALAVGLAAYSTVAVSRLNARTEFRTPYEIARFLDERLEPGETALVVAERFRDLSDAAPMAYQRIVAQSRYGRARLLCSGLLEETRPEALTRFAAQRNVRYLVVFRDFEPWLPADRFFAHFSLSQAVRGRAVFVSGPATVFEVETWEQP